jgi:myo-inositol-hexaphosphate 3-phosphohydrolase
MVIGTLKNAGLAVFDLQGRTLQRIDYADEDARQNNVDLLYGIDLGGTRRELAVVSDRGLDHLRVFAVDQAGSSASAPLTEVSEPDPPVVFEGDNDISAYGIAAWKGRDGAGYVAISQRHRTTLVLLRLVAAPGGTVGFERLERLVLPSTFRLAGGKSWSPCAEEDGELPQVEGMVADARRGLLFAAQEDVGLWRIDVRAGRFVARSCSTASANSARASPGRPVRRRASSSARSTRHPLAPAIQIWPPTPKGSPSIATVTSGATCSRRARAARASRPTTSAHCASCGPS